MDEYSKFKSLLEYFVDYLEYAQNNEKEKIRTKKLRGQVEAGDKLPRGEGSGRKGSGRKPSEKLQKLISEWTSFDGCVRVCFRIGSYRKKRFESAENYLQWDATGYNIVAHWDHNKIDKIDGLQQLIWKVKEKTRTNCGDLVSLKDLDLFSDNPPNETLKKFFDEFKKMYEDDTYKYRNQSTTPSQDMNSKHSELVENLKELLKASHNLILHGAPGTGKTFLAKKIAKEMGAETDFVQFHPSYDYTDFVEGLRPKKVGSDEIGFELKDGVFKKFCKKALKALTVSPVEDNFEEVWKKVVDYLNEHDYIEVPLLSGNGSFRVELNEYGNGLANRTYENDEYKKDEWKRGIGLSKFFSKDQLYRVYKGQAGVSSSAHDNYRKAVIKLWKEKFDLKNYSEKENTENESVKPFVFIIDEINRGEMSKIFGELFYAVDPGYRVTGEALKKHKSGDEKLFTIRTQYANLEKDWNEFDNALNITDPNDFGHFFVPENVYIIGTMNDIDRSVDTMDFAFRRRFAFKEIKANENIEMLDALPEDVREKAINRMKHLNAEIEKIDGLSSAYHIGGAYFKKLEECGYDFEKLWTLHLEGLLREYLRGQEGAGKKLDDLKEDYGNDSDSQNSKDSSGPREGESSAKVPQGEN